MKFGIVTFLAETASRTPQGVRGLKFCKIFLSSFTHKVAPRKGCVD